MWIITLFYCLILMKSNLSKPFPEDSLKTQDDMDNFYRYLKDAFDQYLTESSNVQQGNSKEEDNAAEEETIPDISDFEIKPKRDATGSQKQNEIQEQSGLSSMYPCDRYDASTRTCVNARQIGTTLTIGVQMSSNENNQVRWFRYFKRRNAIPDLREELTKDKSPWNINIGGKNNELRISPITETDFSFNYFVAFVEVPANKNKHQKEQQKQLIKFYIEPINIDMGALYHGEELVIYARAFMELPVNSVVLEWSLSDIEFLTRYDLPSNMKVNSDRSSVVVKELRTSINTVLTCSVFSNQNVFLARRNFLFRKIEQESLANTVSSNSEQIFKIRRKRSYEENEGFLENDYIPNGLGYNSDPQIHDYIRNKNSALNRLGYQFPISSNDKNTINNPDLHSHYSTRFPIDSSFFYNEEENIAPFEKNFASIRRTRQDKFPESERLNYKSHEEQEFPETIPENVPNTDSNFLLPSRHIMPEKIIYNDDDSYVFNKKYSDNSVGDEKFKQSSYLNSKSKHEEDDNIEDENRKASQLDNLIQKANSLNHTPKIKKGLDWQLDTESGQIYSFDDVESMLIANCKDNYDCSVHATCHTSNTENNFCRCSPRYRGNGLFCWLI